MFCLLPHPNLFALYRFLETKAETIFLGIPLTLANSADDIRRDAIVSCCIKVFIAGDNNNGLLSALPLGHFSYNFRAK